MSGDVRRNFQVTDGVNNLNIASHDVSPVSAGITQITGIYTYWTTNSKIDSTLTGGNIVGVSNLPETYKLHFHRPSIINSSSHTWEYSGSVVDYNAHHKTADWIPVLNRLQKVGTSLLLWY